MRKIIVLSFISLDGVIQSPGAPKEDKSDGFKYGGWVAPYIGEVSSRVIEDLMKPSDFLLGRKTFDIWEAYWPKHEAAWPGVNEVTKYVYSNTLETSEWENTIFLNSLEDLQALKNSKGPDIKVWGSSKLVQLLLKHDLVDELLLQIHPLLLGEGKKLFDNTAIPAAYALTESTVTTNGVIIAYYKRSGKVKTGTVGD